MEIFYTAERNAQILISLLKTYGVRKIIASPGTHNVPFVASIQRDEYFEVYSAADERSAAYIACGLAAESGEAVALSCTGATAARNYVPGLTEAYYRKLPILAITSSAPNSRIGHLIPQITDRRAPMPDIARLSVTAPAVHSEEDVWECTIAINRALLELTHRGGGPVHINLITGHSSVFSVKTLPAAKVIRRVLADDELPLLEGKVGIFVGAHLKWSDKLTSAVDSFCEKYNAVVLGDQTANYKGKYGVLPNLVTDQAQYSAPCNDLDVMIHIGEVSGGYARIHPKEVWRVSLDGELRDTYQALSYVFEMSEESFFENYLLRASEREPDVSFSAAWTQEYERLAGQIPELPFSNCWIAQRLAPLLPEGAALHFGILSSLRAWNYFPVSSSIHCYCNTGGFGIDGGVSALIGASLADRDKLFFGVIGDLAFFYDMNSLGNRHIGPNIRLLLANNGRGNEFYEYQNLACRAGLGESVGSYIAAAGHYGSKSPDLVRHYAQDLGFEYLSAVNKEEFDQAAERFLDPQITSKPMLLEVFTDGDDDCEAHRILDNLEVSAAGAAKKAAREILGNKGIQTVKDILGDKGVDTVKKIIKKAEGKKSTLPMLALIAGGVTMVSICAKIWGGVMFLM